MVSSFYLSHFVITCTSESHDLLQKDISCIQYTKRRSEPVSVLLPQGQMKPTQYRSTCYIINISIMQQHPLLLPLYTLFQTSDQLLHCVGSRVTIHPLPTTCSSLLVHLCFIQIYIDDHIDNTGYRQCREGRWVRRRQSFYRIFTIHVPVVT